MSTHTHIYMPNSGVIFGERNQSYFRNTVIPYLPCAFRGRGVGEGLWGWENKYAWMMFGTMAFTSLCFMMPGTDIYNHTHSCEAHTTAVCQPNLFNFLFLIRPLLVVHLHGFILCLFSFPSNSGYWHGNVAVHARYSNTNESYRSILADVSTLTNIRHENIQLFLGVCHDLHSDYISIVME